MADVEVPLSAALPSGPWAGTVERILTTAYDLFCRRRVRDVGINELIESSGVAKSFAKSIAASLIRDHGGQASIEP